MKTTSKVIKLTPEKYTELLRDFSKSSNTICFDEDKGLFVDLTLSTDRSGGDLQELKDFISNVERACNLVGVDINSLPDFFYVYENSDHEIAVQRQYILQNNCVREGFLYRTENFTGIIQSIDNEGGTFVVKDENGKTKTLGITAHISNCSNYFIDWNSW